jgi:hypothetical protein
MSDVIRACPSCGAENNENAKFCSQCATPLETTQEQEIAALEVAAAADATGASDKPNLEHYGAERGTEDDGAERDGGEEAGFAWPTTPEPAAADAGSFTISRRSALIAGGGLAAVVAVVAVVLAVTLSGGSSAKTDRTSADTKPPTQPTKTDPTAQDTDGDGTPDIEDGAVFDANSTTAPEDSSTDEFDDAPSADEEDDYLDDTEEETSHTTVQVGEPAADDDITFKVVSLEAVSSIATDEFSDGPITAKSGTKLVKAVVRWKNNTQKSQDIFCGGGSAILLDQDSRNFDPIDNQIDIAGNNICDDVQPGFTQTVTLAFQMPKDSNTTELVLWNGDSEDDYDGKQTDIRVMK